MAMHDNLRFSISYTTRPKRANEIDGRDYNFIGAKAFAAKIAANDFLEHAQVFDHQYGTSQKYVTGLLNAGHHVILEIDWQGAEQVRDRMSECQSIFILPPTVAELRQRLTGRGTDTSEVIERRFRDAVSDMSHWDDFDFAVINDDLDAATAKLSAIVSGAPAGNAAAVSNPNLQAKVAQILAS